MNQPYVQIHLFRPYAFPPAACSPTTAGKISVQSSIIRAPHLPVGKTQNRKMGDRKMSTSRACFPRDGLHDLLFDGVQVERSGFLNGRELNEGLAELRHLLLDEDEAPELVLEPLSLLHGLPHTRSL